MGGMGNWRFDQYADDFDIRLGDDRIATAALDVTKLDLLVSIFELDNFRPGRF